MTARLNVLTVGYADDRVAGTDRGDAVSRYWGPWGVRRARAGRVRLFPATHGGGVDGRRLHTVEQIVAEFGVTRPIIYRHLTKLPAAAAG